MMILCTTTLYVLMSDRVDNMSLDMKYFNIYIIKTFVPSEINGTNTVFVHWNKSRNHNKNNQVLYSRFFLSIVYSSREQYKMCYAMEFRNTTYLLWVRNVELRYNGSITITTIILVVDPIPIKKYDDRWPNNGWDSVCHYFLWRIQEKDFIQYLSTFKYK